MTALLVILLLIALNGLLAMAEMALASSRRGRLRERAEAGDDGARRALSLYDEPSRFLSTVQIGVAVAGVAAGAVGGGFLAGPLGERLIDWGLAPGAAEVLAYVLVVAAVAYLSLILGERVPKRIGAARPESVSSRAARPMTLAARLASPVVALVVWSTEAVLAPFGLRERPGGGASPEQISGMLERSRRVGRIGWAEVEMIENVFDLEERRVRSMVTPRREVSWLDLDAPWPELRAALLDAKHSRLPVARGELDRLVGLVHVHALLNRCLEGQRIDLATMAEEPLLVPESLSALSLLERFRERGTRFAIVLDEHGGVEGVVTAGDVLVALLGELADGTVEERPNVVRNEDGSFDLDGRLYLEEFKDLLDIPALPREEDRDYRTLGGLVTTLLGRIPEQGDAVVASTWRFEVAAMDGPRVDRVHVCPTDPSEGGVDEPRPGGVVVGELEARNGQPGTDARRNGRPAEGTAGRREG